MNNKDIRESLFRAIDDATPDVLSKILLNSESEKGANTDLQVHSPEEPQSKVLPVPQHNTAYGKKSFRPQLAAVIAAILLIAIITPLAYSQFSVNSVIGIDVNPSIEIKTNKAEKVLSVTALDGDADIVIDGMNLKNVDLKVAVNALIGSMLKHGYITEIKNSILITVENDDVQRGAQLKDTLTNEISTLLNASSLDGAVISQTVNEDERLRSLANQHGISVGKVALVEYLIGQDSRLQFEDIAKLGINEITLLIDSRQTDLQGVTVSGHASSGAYIGEESAKAAVLEYSGLSVDSVTFTKVKLDYDDGRMVYEIDFFTSEHEFEYEIDALNGVLISSDRDVFRSHNQSTQNAANTNPDEYIGEEAAKSIALSHAEVSEADATFISTKLDWDDGVWVYDVEFYSGNIEYDYEIDAVTGVICEYDRDIENYSISGRNNTVSNVPATANPVKTPPPASSPADKVSAKSIALAHAGLSEADVTRIKVEYDIDDGIAVYEVEFRKGNMEYSYEIDIATGSILEWDHDYDD